uniref:PX domain-containing protein n=1 Tax=Monopterus albus TaxID=43700 RepID=A0A3Q3JS08_MONAL
MSEHTVPADLSGHMLDLDEDEDLEVFSKSTSLADGSSMPNSPSSMVNQYRLEEDDEEQQNGNTKDIFITVDNPESHVTAIETFIMYRVLTKTTRSEFDSCEYEVHRRYQDFLWLRSKLEENYPTLIIHPLPEKFVMKGMVERFSNDFIETRRKALHRFLNKISEHPILSYNQHFKVFLTAQELAPHRKQSAGFLSRMGETVRAVANSVRGLSSRPEEFTLMQEYLENFSNKICSVNKVTQRVIKEQREYLDELKQYSPTYVQWAGLEGELAEPLKDVASCVERCSKETEEQIQHLSQVLLPILHEYVLCGETLKMQVEVDGLADRVEMANNALKGDWSHWQNSMRTDLKSAFISTAEKNVEYYEKCLAVWELFLLSQRVEPRKELDEEDVS